MITLNKTKNMYEFNSYITRKEQGNKTYEGQLSITTADEGNRSTTLTDRLPQCVNKSCSVTLHGLEEDGGGHFP